MKTYATKTFTLFCTALFFLSVVPQAFADGETNGDIAGNTGNSAPEKTSKDGIVIPTALEGFKFGVALGLTMDLGDNDRVESADVVNGIVRVTKDNNYSPRIMLETHYFFTPDPEKDLYLKSGTFLGHQEGEFGIGPFVAIQNGSDDFVEYIGAGVMLGFRRGDTKESFNIGLGVVVDPSAKILGDGIVENQPLPEGEKEGVRFKETSQLGLLALVSYAF